MQVYLLGILAFISLIFLLFKIYSNKIQSENYKLASKLEILLEEYQKIHNQNQELQHLYNLEVEEKFSAKQKEALALQKCEAMQAQLQEWEKLKEQSIENAKAAIFEVGHKLSNQLIAEHKRESETHKEEAQKQFKNTTENLYKDFSKLTDTISSLKEQVTSAQNTTNVVYKALLAPNTAGNLAEITLENILKSSNLIPNIDYQMQYSITDQDSNRLRPDAVIFLPGDNILVIDSKASKFFLELGETNNAETAAQIKQKLKTTMRNHLKTLFSKDYSQAVATHLKHKKIKHISTVMFLPTETALEQLQNIDNQLIVDAWQNNIFPAGPVGLVNILAHSKFQITEERKNENYHAIIDEVGSLMYNLSNLVTFAKKLGSNIYNSVNYFDKFAASFNSKIISKAKNLEKLGINVKSNKQIPEMIERYQVISGNKFTMIEGETSEGEEKDE